MSAAPKTVSPCKERTSLALKVADAVSRVYGARQKYEAAEKCKASDASELYDAVLQLRQDERDALKLLRQHIEQHGCST